MTSVLVVGSVALDTLETPFGKRENVLGGSAVHFALSASQFAPVGMVGVAGKDFPEEHIRMLRDRKIDTSGLTIVDGKTFRWHGRFVGDMSRAETVSVHLNVLETFNPVIPEALTATPYVLLGNSHPNTQKAVLDQLKDSRFVMMDTMDLWITNERDALMKLLPRIDALCINIDEAKQLADAPNAAVAIRKLLDTGVKALIMKRGEHGATLATPEYQFTVPAYPTETVTDPTGAGDSFAGGVLGYLAANNGATPPLRQAVLHGSVVGSFTVEAFGTERLQKLTPEEIEARVRELHQMITV